MYKIDLNLKLPPIFYVSWLNSPSNTPKEILNSSSLIISVKDTEQ